MLQLRKRLSAIGEDLARVDAVLVTHEHSDHIAGLPVLGRNRDVHATFWLSRLTEPAIAWGEKRPSRVETFQAGAAFVIGDIEVQSFSIPHDAVDPVGFAFEAQGVKIGFATDLGYVPESVKYHLRRVDLLMIEANHDLDMLKVGPYPWSVKQRVMSRVGHLSNMHTYDYLMQDLDTCTAHLLLGHISEQNNHPAIVQMIADEAKIAPRLLATRADAEELARIVDEGGIEAAAQLPAFSTWRREVLGTALEGWLLGRIAIVGDPLSPHGFRLMPR